MQEDYHSSHTGQQIDNAVDDVIAANSNGGIQSKNIVDIGGYFSTDTVEGALQALGATNQNVQLITNKVTEITATSTDTQYPSAKAVYTFIQSLDGNGVEY